MLKFMVSFKDVVNDLFLRIRGAHAASDPTVNIINEKIGLGEYNVVREIQRPLINVFQT
jgi:hypothetical protein